MAHELNQEGPLLHLQWQEARRVSLSAEDSWLGMIGLFWLEEGDNSLGCSAASLIRLPEGEAHCGVVLNQAGAVRWQPASAPGFELQTDAHAQPSTVDLGNLSFFIVERDGRHALRLRDRHWAAKKPFRGLSYYDYDPTWRMLAAWERLATPLQIEVPNVSGELKKVTVLYQAVFEREGIRICLLPMSVTEHEVFFVFRDPTSGKETYGAGRFLKVPAAVDGQITLDFNYAFNPPCAFTAFATCPLPPDENRLPFMLRAGEKKYECGDS